MTGFWILVCLKKEKQKIEKDIRRKLAENQGTNNNCEPSQKILETK